MYLRRHKQLQNQGPVKSSRQSTLSQYIRRFRLMNRPSFKNQF